MSYFYFTADLSDLVIENRRDLHAGNCNDTAKNRVGVYDSIYFFSCFVNPDMEHRLNRWRKFPLYTLTLKVGYYNVIGLH